MTRITYSIIINSPRENVFSYLSPMEISKWFGNGKIKVAGESEDYVLGFSYEIKGKIYNKREFWEIEVVGHKENKLLSWRVKSLERRSQITWELRRVKNGKTRIIMTDIYKPMGLFKRIKNFSLKKQKRNFHQQFLERLKRLAEENKQ